MPYWRLSGFYFFYFATLGALVPYWSLYLRSVGFSALQIGELMALLMVSRIIAPYLWGWLADHQGQRMVVVRTAALLSVVSFAGVFVSATFWWLAAVMLLFSFFWNATLPQVEAATLSHFGGEGGRYARVRLWGSVGFIVSVLALGWVLDRVPAWWLLPALLVLLSGIWLASLLVPQREVAGGTEHAGPLLRVFLFSAFLMQASHGPYYTFYTIYLGGHGYSKTVIGMLWALGVICEIAIFLVLHRARMRIGIRETLLASFALAAVRWALIGLFPDYLALLILAQVLHAATFGAYHATAVEMVHRFFRGAHQTRGQAIYGSVSFGLGGAVGSLYAGLSWSSSGPLSTFLAASLLALLALVVTWRWIRPATSFGAGGTD
jgi:PPP family 3-phenylpropionic acid transporter